MIETVSMLSLLVPAVGATFLKFYSGIKVQEIIPGLTGRGYPHGNHYAETILTKDCDGVPMVVVPSGGSATIMAIHDEVNRVFLEKIEVFDTRRREGEPGQAFIKFRDGQETFSTPDEIRPTVGGSVQAVWRLTEPEKKVEI
ncbi:hypothetical protein KBC75_04505 [Candidatus Shapirobacteria bacterium]|nr:hypothetical protein [Candidatus Shapirobacteria bacterium]